MIYGGGIIERRGTGSPLRDLFIFPACSGSNLVRLTGEEESPISKSPPRTLERTGKKGKRRGGLTAPGQMSRLARLLGNGNVFGAADRNKARPKQDADH